ncbi:TonB-dependent siderophore receptor [Fulvimonas sp. R45]|uniref:TonB-dependent siderophore receptor n=1 Tax=Fulvimonas sp. R45 TaxID=3045937 RepID=UPI00265ED7E6|nr:TonB-dependent siderophore receptor [Fulvimonas sp. R45]MDO1528166.1 TonB-dependent siderophore receptor [Fulvimonas sp. R45]
MPLPRLRPRCLPFVLSIGLAATTAAAETDPPPVHDQHHPVTLKGVEVTAVAAQDPDAYGVHESRGATRLSLSLRETPQSVSVVTRAQMDDFGLNDINAVLANTTGVNVERVETDRTYFSARGFDVGHFLVDGLGLPLANGAQWGDLDTAVYERIEVLRGANGLLAFTGNPSATVNFVRKRPTADFQGSMGFGLGSWATRRLDMDLSGPLNAAHSVRGRLVAAAQDGDSYLDRYRPRRKVVSGTLEADLGRGTLLSVGLTAQKNASRGGLWGALPLYHTDGTPTRYARSASTSADWSFWDTDDTRAFVRLERELAGGWSLKAALNYRRLVNDSNLFYVYGTPDAATGLGLLSYPSRYGGAEKQYVADVYASGPFMLGGRQHELVVGVDWARDDDSELSGYSNGTIGQPLPPLQDWHGDFPRPDFDDSYSGAHIRSERQGAYLTARWNLADGLTLITGSSLAHVRAEGANYGVPNAYSRTRATPFAGAVLDLSKHYSLYASYARLFNPQTQLDADNRVLDPVTGSNLEAGLKGAWYDGALNASFALFRAKQDHLAEAAGHNAQTNRDYYRGIDATSRGFEFDAGGRLGRDWELSAGYTQLRLDAPDGKAVRTYVPRRNVHLAARYRVAAVPGLRLGATLRWQDAIRRDQGALDTQGREIVTRQGSYALLGLMAGYDFAPGWSATLNLDNLTNRKYLTSLYWDQAYYGAPRRWMLDLRYRF